MDVLQFVTGLGGNLLNYSAQKDQLEYQEELNDWNISNYNNRNQAFKDALLSANLGQHQLGLGAHMYLNNKSNNYSFTDFLRANPHLAKDNPADVYDMYQNIVARLGINNGFDINDFINLYNIGQTQIQREREDTAISRAAKDWERAGFNPLLFGGSASATGSYQTSGGSNTRPSGLNAGSYSPFNTAVSTGDLADDMVKFSQAENIRANTELAQAQKDKVGADTLYTGELTLTNAVQRRLYVQQIHNLASELPLNQIKRDMLINELAGLQWNLKVAKDYGLPVGQQVSLGIAGLNKITEDFSGSGKGYYAAGLLGLASLYPMFRIGSAAGRSVLNFGSSKFGYERVKNVFKNFYQKTFKSTVDKFFK